MVAHQVTLTQILNNPDILEAVIHCIAAEKLSVEKQV